MDMNVLKYMAFIKTVEYGSFTRAAELILKRTPYRIAARKLDVPAYREIVLALRSVKNAPLVVKHFLGYLNFRDSGKNGTRET